MLVSFGILGELDSIYKGKKMQREKLRQNKSKIISGALLLSTSLCNVAFAEKSGAFLGAEVGYGGASVEYKSSYTEQNLTTGEIYGYAPYTLKYNGGGVKYGIIAGYKQFFTPYLGLRYYASLSAMHALLSTTSSGVSQQWKNVSATMINYGVNVDFLGNFIVQESLDFGGFVGLGLGGTSWVGKSIDDYQKLVIDSYNQGWGLSKNSFDVALNVGLRANIAKRHGVEIVARVPFLATKLFDKTYQGRFDNTGGGDSYLYTQSEKTTIHHPYSITARYTFSF